MQKSPLSSTAMVSAPSKKSFSRVSSTILTCSIFTSIGASSDDDFLIPAKNIVCPGKKLIAPLFNLVGMNIVLLSKLTKRLLSMYGCKCNVRFETGCVITAWASCHDSFLIDGKVCQLQVKNPTYINSSDLSSYFSMVIVNKMCFVI